MFAQFGAWVEGAIARKDGKGLRKVWVTGDRAAGESMRLSVIAGDGDSARHVLTLRVDSPEQRAIALEALTLAIALLSEPVPAPAKIAPKKASPKPPTPPAKAPASKPAPVSVPAAPEAADWFSQIMAQA